MILSLLLCLAKKLIPIIWADSSQQFNTFLKIPMYRYDLECMRRVHSELKPKFLNFTLCTEWSRSNWKTTPHWILSILLVILGCGAPFADWNHNENFGFFILHYTWRLKLCINLFLNLIKIWLTLYTMCYSVESSQSVLSQSLHLFYSLNPKGKRWRSLMKIGLRILSTLGLDHWLVCCFLQIKRRSHPIQV